MTSRAPAALAALLAAVLPLAGCATLQQLPRVFTHRAAADERLVRPEAPPEYDVLVAQQFEIAGKMEDALAAYERALDKDPDAPYLHRKVAEALARQGRLEEATEHGKRALALAPDDVATRYFLGQLYRLTRDPDAGAKILRDESGQPLDERCGYLLFQILIEAERADEALDVAEWLVDQDPDSLRARVALATAYQRLDRPEDAEAALRDALLLDPENPRVYAELSRWMRERGEQKRVVGIYRDILALHPDSHAALFYLAEALVETEDLDGAIKAFEEVEKRYPDDVRATMRLAFLLYEARRYDDAAARFERVLKDNPQEYEVAFFLGIVRRRSGDSDAAMKALELIPPNHKHYAEARTQIAAILERRGDYKGALAEVEKAMAANPSRALDLYAATLRSKSGDFDGAIARLEKLLAENPGDDELLYNLGVVYGEAKRIEDAIRYMRLALEQNPDNASALNYIGYTWAEQGINLDEAESMITRAIDLRPDDGYIVDSLGWVYYMRALPLVESGHKREARKYIERALEQLKRAEELTGGDPVVSEHIGDAYLLLNQRRRALDKYEEALRLEPREGEQPNLVEKLESLRRELD